MSGHLIIIAPKFFNVVSGFTSFAVFTPIVFQRFGQGSNVLLTFHGFGQSPNVFAPLATDCTLYSIALPVRTEPSVLIFAKTAPHLENYLAAFRDFLDRQAITNFSLVAFSIGARVALLIATHFPHRIKKITLLAPDGLCEQLPYRFATATLLGRAIFYLCLKSAVLPLNIVLRLLAALGYSRQNKIFWLLHQLSRPKQSALVVKTWLSCRFFRPNLARLADKLPPQTPITLILASSDFIIRPKHTAALSEHFPNLNTQTLESTHSQLLNRWMKSLNAKLFFT